MKDYGRMTMKHQPSIIKQSESGSVLLVVVLLVALLAAVVMGHLEVNTEEIQLVRNHTGGAEALALAEAGLNEALARLRQDPGWDAGFVDKPFASGTYTVVVNGATVTSTALTSRGFVAKVEAEVTTAPPGLIQIEKLRINR
jgi:hypothetical protein